MTTIFYYSATSHKVLNHRLAIDAQGLANDFQASLRRPPSPVSEEKQRPIAVTNAKRTHKQFRKTKPSEWNDERNAVIRALLDSKTPNWGSLNIRLS